MSIIQVIYRKLECDFKKIEKHLDSSFDKINNIIDQIFLLDFPISKFNNIKSELSLPKVDQFKLIGQSFQSKIVQELTPLMNSKIKQQVQIQLQSEQDHSQSLTKQQLSQSLLKQQEQQIQSQFNLKSFKYQIIGHNSIKQVERYYAVAFNKDCSIVAAGCYSLIKLYEFRQEMLNQIQVLDQHKQLVSTLNFMKKFNQFISGDWSGSISNWTTNKNKQWNFLQTLNGHNNQINCFIMNNNEDIIISSSSDTLLSFGLEKKNGSVNKQSQIINIVFFNQLQMNNKIKLFHMDGINQYQQLNIKNRIKSGWQYKILKLIVKDIDYVLSTIIFLHFNLGQAIRCISMR